MDRQQVDAFVVKEYQALIGAIRRKLGLDEVASMDLAHEAIMRIYDSLDRFDPEKGNLGMWSSGILRNLMLQYREGRMRPFVLDAAIEEAAPKDRPQTGRVVVDEIGEFMARSVDTLPEIYRDVVRLRYMDGLDLKKISKKLKLPLGTVKARLSRAPGILKSALQIQETTARFYLEQLRQKKV